jgi:hypothetical protein
LNGTQGAAVSLVGDDDDVAHSQVNLVLKESELNNEHQQGNIDNSVVETDGKESSEGIDSEKECEFTNSEFYGDTQSIVNSQILL